MQYSRLFDTLHAVQPAENKNRHTPETWFTANDIKTLRELKIRLCQGFSSPCRKCEVQCAFGRLGREKYNYETPAMSKWNKSDAAKKQHKCVGCWKTLPDGWKKVYCAECAHREKERRRKKRGL